MFRMLSDFGDHELVLSGLHENMLSQRYLDTHMERTCSLFGHLQAADQFMTATGRTMDFAFMAYLPAAMLAVRAVVASPDRRGSGSGTCSHTHMSCVTCACDHLPCETSILGVEDQVPGLQ